MRLSVIGCGYVGLVTGACLAEAGHEVVCTDKDTARIGQLNAGQIPIYELHLEGIVARNRSEGRLKFTADAGEAVRAGDAVFICVGTPPLENGGADLSAIDAVARLIATESQNPKLVVEKSTVPAETGRQLKQALAVYGRKSGVTFRVASNPEFLREGTAVEDFLHPDRIVVGVDEESAEKQLREVYQPILEGRFNCPVHAPACPPQSQAEFVVTNINSAELIKHASNSFLALKISYANAISDLCELLGANVEEVTRAIGLDPRIGGQFLRAGLGFGGFCLPKDVQAFIHLAERAGMDFALLKEAERINKRRIQQFVEKIRRALWVIKGKKIGVLGLAFKPHTDDTRFSPPIDLIRQLLSEGAEISAYDPAAMERARQEVPQIRYGKDPYDVADGADALVIATEWPEFAALDWEKIHSSMARPLVLDGRNLLKPAQMAQMGFEYHSFGRPE
ncbi:MAG TPA: UDP-glucose/GDP-mannose dehydrogenase family protein [Terriglobia bacterium]|jgi:UDPglucose 6-dehydrogenase|nr:UDP-glucose/GDP-mannose dehydrogenase family protein [Terriglobia bacterium]